MYLNLKDNYERIKDRIAEACLLSGRKRQDVLLLAVSKFHSVSAIETVAGLGQRDFGENYFQEWRQKKSELDAGFPLSKELRWHMTGRLQSRKGHAAAGKFELIHTLDSEKLALVMQKSLHEQNQRQRVLMEVNIANEPQKSGLAPAELEKFAQFVLEKCPRLDLAGLMCMPPADAAGEKSAVHFRLLAKLREDLQGTLHVPLPELSMGMTSDFPWAIAEGATIVRIGTAIFGRRPSMRKALR